ncbi:hypothetical protein PanWU01x14_296540 [Parasponia andersonii]|uniref:Pollen Ole e 1 allergen and extensin family protein n=1 Tax=Parasponia andersonii TaxID=3476 RepID=A0A2P5AVI3_PARAD|nr:hypothetical protein PanWU01x14_296540 [Parasponia andersonii]
MALVHILYPVFLSSLVVIASANNYYVSTQNYPNVGNQPNGNLVGSHVNYLNFNHHLIPDHQDQLLDNHDLIRTNSKPADYVYGQNPQGGQNVVDQIVGGGLIPNTISTIGIQGVILCKTGINTYVPIEGAVARVTCPNYSYVNGQKYYKDVPSSILSYATDANGFFVVRFSVSQLIRGFNVKDCKVYAEYSPLDSCNVPTDVNNGISGANLSLLNTLIDNISYTAGPFIYTSKTNKNGQYSAPSPAGY